MCNLRFTYIQSHKQGSFKHMQILQRQVYSKDSSFVSVSAYDPDGMDLLVTASYNERVKCL